MLSLVPQSTDAQRRRSKGNPTFDSLVTDSLSLPKTDTTAKKKDALEAPVTFSSTDSTVMTAVDGFARMYGNAKINYQTIELTAAVVAMNMDSSIVHANGVKDTMGTIQGKPVF